MGWNDSEKAPLRSAVAVQCSSTWGDASATKAPQLRYLRNIWITGRRSHLQVLPPVQTEILRKRLKSEPLVWIWALAACFSSQSSQGWVSDKTFQVYLTETWLVVTHHALASPTACLWQGRQAGHGQPSPPCILISARDARQRWGWANICRDGKEVWRVNRLLLIWGLQLHKARLSCRRVKGWASYRSTASQPFHTHMYIWVTRIYMHLYAFTFTERLSINQNGNIVIYRIKNWRSENDWEQQHKK